MDGETVGLSPSPQIMGVIDPLESCGVFRRSILDCGLLSVSVGLSLYLLRTSVSRTIITCMFFSL